MNKQLKSRVLKKIKPSKEDKKILETSLNKILSMLNKSKTELNYECDFFVGGSYGKKTYLRGKSDVDIFCRFATRYPEKDLSGELELIITRSGLKYKKEKGSRDYFSGKFEKVSFEVIPVYNIKDAKDAKNLTDVSCLHVDYLDKITSENKSLIDEIRLAKQFLKAKNLYGAESYINGFSGHVIELLVSHYGSFQKFIDSAKDWKETTVIDPLDEYKTLALVQKVFSKDKLSSLVVIDPIQRDRNAARALSTQNYSKLIFILNTLTTLKESDFTIKNRSFKKIESDTESFAKKHNLKYVFYRLTFKPDEESEDIIGSKLLKIFSKIEQIFKDNDFCVYESNFEINMFSGKCLFVYYFEQSELPKIKKFQGPKVFLKDAVSSFTKKRRNYEIINDRVYAIEQRKVHSLKQVYDIKLSDLKKIFSRDISFVKSISKKSSF